MTGALKGLVERGLVDHARYGHATLTETGTRLALDVERRHLAIRDFLTDVLGVKDADGLVIRWLDLNTAADLTQKSVIFGGMLPKLDACRNALLHGVNRVRILPAEEVETLPEFYFTKIESGSYQWVREKLQSEGISIPLPTGN